MNLIVDVGNTFVKFAVFQDDKLIYKVSFELSEFKKEFKLLKKEFPELRKAIVSSVGRLSKKQIDIIDEDLKLHELNYKTKLPFKSLYKTPKTLGVDRIALVSGSVSQFPYKNVLIIDAGTCITYDFVTSENDYLGGAISPGIRLRYQSLNNLTANLPLLEKDKPKTIIGDSTESSIHSGVVIGIIKEIDGVIEEYRAKHQDLTVILTGGDANFLSNQLKNSIFANSNFLLEGLNFILDFNSK
ncbi:type III pantothenate kinase [Winogradskyella sp. PE311]|uniref:type III pantothenate kinase n=1 Tax=Winogradskyella sp. PE311 TaxID=3366943 RepID=UPI00397EE2B8